MSTTGETIHVPVMPAEVLEALGAARGGLFLDCTLGGGGHVAAVLGAHPENRVIAFDRDGRALQRAAQRFADQADRVELRQGTFQDVEAALGASAHETFDGMLADLGISTDQLKEKRGFSFADDTALDMRMDEQAEHSAWHVVNESAERELVRILKVGGVGNEATSIARAIVRSRPIETTKQLATLIADATPARLRKAHSNPATVPFQAIRIAVNAEFEQIDALLQTAPRLVKSGGRFAVITFHSGEDKYVARAMRDWEQGDTTPARMRAPLSRTAEDKSRPRTERLKAGASIGKQTPKKAVTAGEEEVERNPSSRSARLRVFEFA